MLQCLADNVDRTMRHAGGVSRLRSSEQSGKNNSSFKVPNVRRKVTVAILIQGQSYC